MATEESSIDDILCEIHATDVVHPRKWKRLQTSNCDTLLIVLIYGSWNVRIFRLLGMVPPWVSMMKKRHPEFSYASVSVKVDADDESYEICIKGACDQELSGLEAPPELPSIALIGASSSTESHYQEKIAQKIHVEHVQLYGPKLESLLAHGAVTCESNVSGWNRLMEYIDVALSKLVEKTRKWKPAHSTPHSTLISNDDTGRNSAAIRIFIAGDKSQVGKSTVCMGLLGALLKSGKYLPSDLAYIKPATQCEQTQLIQEFCKSKGITACVPIGPIVYYKGFTRSFLKGEICDSSEQLLQKACESVDKVAQGKKIVIIDGVGYPSVGSITGTDNASLAKVCGRVYSSKGFPTSRRRAPAPVLLIGKSGVGDAIDSFNINATYFSHRNIPVIGVIFNKLSLDGFYSLENCKEAINIYFSRFQPDKKAFGFIPEMSLLKEARDSVENVPVEEQLKQLLFAADLFVDVFTQCIDVDAIINAAQDATEKNILDRNEDSNQIHNPVLANELQTISEAVKHSWVEMGTSAHLISPPAFSLTRDQIEARALAAGASGG